MRTATKPAGKPQAFYQMSICEQQTLARLANLLVSDNWIVRTGENEQGRYVSFSNLDSSYQDFRHSLYGVYEFLRDDSRLPELGRGG